MPKDFYTDEDIQMINRIIQGYIPASLDMLAKYDVNGDNVINVKDLKIIQAAVSKNSGGTLRISAPKYRYTQADNEIIKGILLGRIKPTRQHLALYDHDNDGRITPMDYSQTRIIIVKYGGYKPGGSASMPLFITN